MLRCALLFAFALFEAHAQIPDEQWGYIDVRKGAHMFWWFYGADASAGNRAELPVVMWLQGGPGAGGTGFGNFGEFGKLDVNLQPRQYAWTTKVNLLFIDNPVGAGYSYVDNTSLLTTDVEQIAQDLLVLHVELFKSQPYLQKLPYWVFSESYGGKMTAVFGTYLYKAVQTNQLTATFKGVMLGDSWIDGIEYVNTWTPYLYGLSVLDDNENAALNKLASETAALCAKGQWQNCTNYWGKMEGLIEESTDNIDFYNSLVFDNPTTKSSDLLSARYYHLDHLDKYLSKRIGVINESAISKLMNSAQLRQKLSIPANVTWGGQSNAVFSAQEVDFMKPVWNFVDELLLTPLSVNVWNGQLDLICDTLGTLRWIEKLKWTGLAQWQATKKKAKLKPNNDVGSFSKKYQNFAMYFIMKAGHMVPSDNPIAALDVVCEITGC